MASLWMLRIILLCLSSASAFEMPFIVHADMSKFAPKKRGRKSYVDRTPHMPNVMTDVLTKSLTGAHNRRHNETQYSNGKTLQEITNQLQIKKLCCYTL